MADIGRRDRVTFVAVARTKNVRRAAHEQQVSTLSLG
jgi:DNA-binding transcriptional LysR family regulator